MFFLIVSDFEEHQVLCLIINCNSISKICVQGNQALPKPENALYIIYIFTFYNILGISNIILVGKELNSEKKSGIKFCK